MPRLGLISPYTGSNLGDAAIIESARRQLLDRFENAELTLLVLDPASVSEIHGLNAFPLAALQREFYFTPWEMSTGIDGAEAFSSQSGARSFRQHIRAGLKRICGHIPFALPVARRIRGGFQKFEIEARHLLDARRIIGDLDGLLIAGGGQFDDEFGGPWGHPYSVHKWVRLAYSRGVPVFMAGVGVEGFRYRLSGWFFRRTLAIARRVSLRDAGSIEALRKQEIRRELVLCPDLAFGFRNSTDYPPLDDARSSSHSTMIGLSPMAFGRPGSWPTAAEDSFNRYWREFQALAHSLIRENHSISIFTTDDPDYHLAQILYNQLTADSKAKDRVHLLPKLKLPDLMAALGNFDVVVASRLHGVLLSHVSRTPVLAISYRPKVSAQMEAMGHERFCLDFETFRAHEALLGLNSILAERGRLLADLERACRERHKAVVNEFAAICADLPLNSG